VVLDGSPRDYPFGKDIILYLAGRYSDSFAQNYAIEFTGPLAESMSLSNRLTIADHAVEVGAKFGFFLADDKVRRYAEGGQPVAADADASYAREIRVNCDDIGFQVAKPYRFDNVVPVGETAGVRIDQARLGSCANGRFEDIEIAARMIEGRKVDPRVRFYVSPASMSVYKQCVDAGLVGILLEAGVQFDRPGCSICQSPGVVLNEEVCISSTTRNYHGRLGGATCADAQIYLASPATVTASAIAGEIVDPTEYLR
jgi:3-isopropylmalate/(R)-2-methylmalate dehydratase large subunit